MAKQLTKEVFGVPSVEVIGLIDANDKVAALGAARYRYETRYSELTRQYEAKVAELRNDYLTETLGVHGGEE